MRMTKEYVFRSITPAAGTVLSKCSWCYFSFFIHSCKEKLISRKIHVSKDDFWAIHGNTLCHLLLWDYHLHAVWMSICYPTMSPKTTKQISYCYDTITTTIWMCLTKSKWAQWPCKNPGFPHFSKCSSNGISNSASNLWRSYQNGIFAPCLKYKNTSSTEYSTTPLLRFSSDQLSKRTPK